MPRGMWCRRPGLGPEVAGEQQRSVALPAFAWPETVGATVGAPVHLQLSSNGTLLSLQMPAGRTQATAVEGQARQWLLDLSSLKDLKDERALFLSLDWPTSAAGLNSAVQIERSDDGQQWSGAGQGRLLELAAAGAPRIDTLDWMANAPLPRYLRLRFESAIALKSARLGLSRRLAAPAPLQRALSFEPVAGEPAQWQVDLQGRLAPQALALQLPAGNQLMNLRLEQRNAESEAWRPSGPLRGLAHAAWRRGQQLAAAAGGGRASTLLAPGCRGAGRLAGPGLACAVALAAAAAGLAGAGAGAAVTSAWPWVVPARSASRPQRWPA